jgi:excisionase family DNA binding protein
MSTKWKGTSRGDTHTSTNKPESTEQGPALGKVYGVDELAVFFNCSTEKIKRRARAGELPAFKFGKSWFVRERDLAAYIQLAVEANLPRRMRQH